MKNRLERFRWVAVSSQRAIFKVLPRCRGFSINFDPETGEFRLHPRLFRPRLFYGNRSLTSPIKASWACPLARDPDFEAIQTRLEARLRRWMEDTGDTRVLAKS